MTPEETLESNPDPTGPLPPGTPTEEEGVLIKRGRGYLEKVAKKIWYPPTPTSPAGSGSSTGPAPSPADAPDSASPDSPELAPPKPKIPTLSSRPHVTSGNGGGIVIEGFIAPGEETTVTGWDDPDPDDSWEVRAIYLTAHGFGIIWGKKKESPTTPSTPPTVPDPDPNGPPLTPPELPSPPIPNDPPPSSLPPGGAHLPDLPDRPTTPSAAPQDSGGQPPPSEQPSQPTAGEAPAAPTPGPMPALPSAPLSPPGSTTDSPNHPGDGGTPAAPTAPVPPPPPPPPPPPQDATPGPGPTPPPMSGPAPTPPRSQQPPVASGPSSRPASGPLGNSAGSPDEGSGRRGKKAAHTTDWRAWWAANAGPLRAARPQRIRVTTESALDGVGGESMPSVEPASRRAVTTLLLPTLRAVLATADKSQSETIAAAIIALAKASDDPIDAARIASGLTDTRVTAKTREAAAIALGCFRRTRPPPAFGGAFYDGLRTRLFAAIDDKDQSQRTRCFAALSLGILGDQANDEHDVFAKDGRLVIRGLWLRLDRPDTNDDTAVALLVALSLQNPRGVPSAVRSGLRRLALSGDAGRRRHGALVRSHAMLALARLGDGDGVSLAMSIVKAQSEDANVRRSALLALGVLAPRLEDADRERFARLLLVQARSGEPNTAGLALISVARLISARLADGGPCEATQATLEALVEFAERGSADVRPFAAIAVGLVTRPVGRVIDDIAFIESRDRALDRLRRVYADDGEDPALRGAFAIALGIADDTRARVQLEATVLSRRSDPELAAHACAGLGLLGDVTRSTLMALRAGMKGRAPAAVQFEAARALGLMGETRAIPSLMDRLSSSVTEQVLARTVTLLGAVGDGTAIAPMCGIARRTTGTDLTRAIACTGLGMLGDAERSPSLSRLGADSNYLARTEALEEILSIL